ncbi:conserved Plasmodium protein, unknown function, partial [Plasmodium ovale curtisi]
MEQTKCTVCGSTSFRWEEGQAVCNECNYVNEAVQEQFEDAFEEEDPFDHLKNKSLERSIYDVIKKLYKDKTLINNISKYVLKENDEFFLSFQKVLIEFIHAFITVYNLPLFLYDEIKKVWFYLLEGNIKHLNNYMPVGYAKDSIRYIYEVLRSKKISEFFESVINNSKINEDIRNVIKKMGFSKISYFFIMQNNYIKKTKRMAEFYPKKCEFNKKYNLRMLRLYNKTSLLDKGNENKKNIKKLNELINNIKEIKSKDCFFNSNKKNYNNNMMMTMMMKNYKKEIFPEEKKFSNVYSSEHIEEDLSHDILHTDDFEYLPKFYTKKLQNENIIKKEKQFNTYTNIQPNDNMPTHRHRNEDKIQKSNNIFQNNVTHNNTINDDFKKDENFINVERMYHFFSNYLVNKILTYKNLSKPNDKNVSQHLMNRSINYNELIDLIYEHDFLCYVHEELNKKCDIEYLSFYDILQVFKGNYDHLIFMSTCQEENTDIIQLQMRNVHKSKKDQTIYRELTLSSHVNQENNPLEDYLEENSKKLLNNKDVSVVSDLDTPFQVEEEKSLKMDTNTVENKVHGKVDLREWGDLQDESYFHEWNDFNQQQYDNISNQHMEKRNTNYGSNFNYDEEIKHKEDIFGSEGNGKKWTQTLYKEEDNIEILGRRKGKNSEKKKGIKDNICNEDYVQNILKEYKDFVQLSNEFNMNKPTDGDILIATNVSDEECQNEEKMKQLEKEKFGMKKKNYYEKDVSQEFIPSNTLERKRFVYELGESGSQDGVLLHNMGDDYLANGEKQNNQFEELIPFSDFKLYEKENGENGELHDFPIDKGMETVNYRDNIADASFCHVAGGKEEKKDGTKKYGKKNKQIDKAPNDRNNFDIYKKLEYINKLKKERKWKIKRDYYSNGLIERKNSLKNIYTFLCKHIFRNVNVNERILKKKQMYVLDIHLIDSFIFDGLYKNILYITSLKRFRTIAIKHIYKEYINYFLKECEYYLVDNELYKFRCTFTFDLLLYIFYYCFKRLRIYCFPHTMRNYINSDNFNLYHIFNNISESFYKLFKVQTLFNFPLRNVHFSELKTYYFMRNLKDNVPFLCIHLHEHNNTCYTKEEYNTGGIRAEGSDGNSDGSTDDSSSGGISGGSSGSIDGEGSGYGSGNGSACTNGGPCQFFSEEKVESPLMQKKQILTFIRKSCVKHVKRFDSHVVINLYALINDLIYKFQLPNSVQIYAIKLLNMFIFRFRFLMFLYN